MQSRANDKETEKESILDFIDRIKESGSFIIVEGTKDKKALNVLGMPNSRIFTLNKPLYKVAENVASKAKQCIILTDLDKEGKKLYSAMLKDLSRLGVRIDNKFRDFLFNETKLRQIEGLPHYLGKLSNNSTRIKS